MAVICIAVVGVVPVALNRDSFPLSTFPMFASQRTSSETVDTAVARAGTRIWRLDPERIAATDEVILAAATVSDAIANGHADRLCAEIAQRVLSAGPREATAVEVVTEQYDAVQWFAGQRTPLQRQVHAQCAVPQRQP
ncbi:MAG: hypothetical protein JWL70_93 [Acidimicrobiia bacterium]|nr:hypothetical protein [Acidimicrobiia bacterium]